MQNNINLPALGMTPVALAALSRNVVSKMTGNTNFPTPTVDLKLVSDKTAELDLAIDQANGGSRLSKIERNTLASELAVMLRSLVPYVRSVCNGDKAMLVTSGFELSKTRERHGQPGMPVIKAAQMTGITGQVELKWDKQRGAYIYQIWMTDTDPATNANWQPVSVSTKVTALIDNLESYKAYWFCVSAIGAAGEGAKSDPTIARAA